MTVPREDHPGRVLIRTVAVPVAMIWGQTGVHYCCTCLQKQLTQRPPPLPAPLGIAVLMNTGTAADLLIFCSVFGAAFTSGEEFQPLISSAEMVLGME